MKLLSVDSKFVSIAHVQVYSQLREYALSLSPPVQIDISKESIPPAIIISYMRKSSFSILSIIMHTLTQTSFVYMHAGVLFTGRGKPVTSDDGTPLLMNSGSPRLGRGLAESTFRKIYHGLRTLHIHFQKQSEYKASYDVFIQLTRFIHAVLCTYRERKCLGSTLGIPAMNQMLYPMHACNTSTSTYISCLYYYNMKWLDP